MPAPQINLCVVNIGCVGSGKSTRAVYDALAAAKEHQAQIVIHDVGGSALRDRGRFGQVHYVEYHDRNERPDRRARVHLLNTGEAEDAVLFAQGLQRTPADKVVIVVDEISVASQLFPSYVGEPWRGVITRRRWMGLGFVFVMQTPTMASRFLTGLCTDVRLFRLEHDDDLKAAKKLGFTAQQIARVKSLRRGAYIERSQSF